MNNVSQFFIEVIPNVVGTVMGGIILYWILENPIKSKIEKFSKDKTIKNAMGDLEYNDYLSGEILKKEKEYLETNNFTVAKYRTRSIIEFFYSKPISKFNYNGISTLIHTLQVDNSLFKLIFDVQDQASKRTNKEVAINNTKIVRSLIKTTYEAMKKRCT